MTADGTDRDELLARFDDRSSRKCFLDSFPHLRSSAFICVHLRTISSLHTGPHAHALTNHRQSPLMGELLAVLLEQPFGVDAVPLERATPEVVDEQVMSHGQLET